MSTRMEFYISGKPKLEKPYHLKGIGLPNVYLLNGVEIENDPNYGELITITKLTDLHQAIGLHIVAKRDPLTGAELRFLRKQMRMTQEELAKHLRVSDQTVANYEKGKTKGADLGPTDLAVRVRYMLHAFPEDQNSDLLRGCLEAINHMRAFPPIPKPVRAKITGPWREDGLALAA